MCIQGDALSNAGFLAFLEVCPLKSSVTTTKVMVLVTPCATGVPAEVDEDGNIKWEPDNKILFYCVVTIRVLGFILLYGGIITVMTGHKTKNKENANGRGAVPL